MTRKQRLSLGARILSSIDARRKRTRDSKAFLAVEQAIVDRELAELGINGSPDQESALKISVSDEVLRWVDDGRNIARREH